jgi:murein DD-endopeptidase MepM/ murein hydrolase activator NlpD
MPAFAPTLEFPLRGAWAVVRSPGHHRYAFDFAAVSTPAGGYFRKPLLSLLWSGASVEDSHSWARSVHAPLDAEVAEVCDHVPDSPTVRAVVGQRVRVFRARPKPHDVRALAGNYVMLRSQRWFVLLAHLKRGSIRVSAGETIAKGQALAEVGNSGSSLAPHLHLQVLDAPDPQRAATIGFVVTEYDRWNGRQWQPARYRELVKGERVRFGCDES